ncbi:arginase [Paenisporosarcina quisquiliarum]|jgi:arginase|uniref:arginase n=1 Tax=Psychrobacillus TaxID=1221880 RepID=UPI0008D53948|nr:arginase [Psychrobacillus psychrodurans]MCK1997450.1 arginase [Psychrobacillus psychrodurans]MCZ8542264.1 arginase [Psychrobacillus psychrodurans]SEM96310.1 arginase [Paenisporosarcina quisquiliarum]SFN23740.1 arginase [Psychrobacillus psychrodurans]
MSKLNISIIGVPMDLGQNRRGVDMGPSAIRYAGVVERLQELGHSVDDVGDIAIGRRETSQNTKLRNLEEVVAANTILANRVHDIIGEGNFPIVLGGDHSIAIGTLAGLADRYDNLGVIWYDAHADLNTAETSPSGNIHGMPLAVSIGLGHEALVNIRDFAPKIKPENVVIIGARSVDPGERDLIKEKGIKVFSMHEIDKLGMSEVMTQTIQYFKDRKVDGVHLSLDLDGLDPLYTPGVGTPVAGGITYRESHLAMEMLYASEMVTSAEFVEVNPILDEKNKTADVAVGLMGSLLGESLV